jgi:hypothetical protein
VAKDQKSEWHPQFAAHDYLSAYLMVSHLETGLYQQTCQRGQVRFRLHLIACMQSHTRVAYGLG